MIPFGGDIMEEQDLETKRGFFSAPSSKWGFALVICGILIAETTFASDYAFLHEHHLPTAKAWLYQVFMLCGLYNVLAGFSNNGLRKVRGTWQNMSTFFFCNAIFLFLAAQTFERFNVAK